MPLKTFVSLSINHLKDLCKCKPEKILTMWCESNGNIHYRAQFIVPGGRMFETTFDKSINELKIQEVKILSTTKVKLG